MFCISLAVCGRLRGAIRFRHGNNQHRIGDWPHSSRNAKIHCRFGWGLKQKIIAYPSVNIYIC